MHNKLIKYSVHTQGKFLQIRHTFTAAVSMLKNITRIII